MAKIVEYGTYIIDITDAMIEHRRGLSLEQLELLNQINDHAVAFVTACLENENTDLPTLYRYLDHEAPRLVTLINHHSEFLLKFRKLHTSYRDAIKNIHQCSQLIQDELVKMKRDLQAFMARIGLNESNKKKVAKPRKRRLRRLKNKPQQQSLNVDYLEGEPLPLEPKPQTRIKRLGQAPAKPKSQPKNILYPRLIG